MVLLGLSDVWCVVTWWGYQIWISYRGQQYYYYEPALWQLIVTWRLADTDWTVERRGEDINKHKHKSIYYTSGRSSLGRKINLKRSKILNIPPVQRVILLLHFVLFSYFLLCGVAIFLFKYKNSCQYHLFLSHQLR